MPTQKAYILVETGARIDCLFNPAELAISKTNSWDPGEPHGGNEPQMAYSGANPGTMSLDLTFDTTDTGQPVTSYTDKIMHLLDVDPSLPGSDEENNNVRPPYITFNWGAMRSFKSVVMSVSTTFTYFSSTGVPLRAKVVMELTQYQPDNAFGRQNPTSGTPRPHKVHRVQPGETLDRIAATHYGDSNRWRLLATANGITDPLALKPGSLLSIPRSE